VDDQYGGWCATRLARRHEHCFYGLLL